MTKLDQNGNPLPEPVTASQAKELFQCHDCGAFYWNIHVCARPGFFSGLADLPSAETVTAPVKPAPACLVRNGALSCPEAD